MKRNSGFIGPKIKTSTDTAKGIHDIHDVHVKRLVTQWPRAELYVSLTPSTTTVTEGNSMTFTLVTEHIANGSTLYYTVDTIVGSTMVDADFSQSPNNGGVDGSFTTTNDSTVLTFGLVAELSPGVAENNIFRLTIKTGSTSGTIVQQSTLVMVTDAVALGTDIRSNFYEISNRSYQQGLSSDWNGPYDVGEIQQGYSGSARVYIALKCNTSTTFYNDICIAAVQILNSSNVIQQTWNFSANSNQNWQTSTRVNGTSSLLSSYVTPSVAAAYSWPAYIGAPGNTNVGLATGTGSAYTGAADGIANYTSTVYSVGDGTVSQSSGTYYIYGEVSGATRYSHVVARSPFHNFSGGDKIRVVHLITIPTNMASTVNVNDAIWIGIY